MQINIKRQIVNNHQFAKNITQYLFFVTIIASLEYFIGQQQQRRWTTKGKASTRDVAANRNTRQGIGWHGMVSGIYSVGGSAAGS